MYYNQTQNFYYNRALHGLKAYSQEEIDNMFWRKKMRIIKVYKRTQQILNKHKVEKLNQKTNRFLTQFYNSNLCKELIETSNDIDYKLTTFYSFKELKITKDEIVALLIKEQVLPYNFYEL